MRCNFSCSLSTIIYEIGIKDDDNDNDDDDDGDVEDEV